MENHELHSRTVRKRKYSKEQMQSAVNHYLHNGRNISHTIRELGYPSRVLLVEWIKELAPNQYRKYCVSGKPLIKSSLETKIEAVKELLSRDTTAAEVAKTFNVKRCSLYNWAHSLLKEEFLKEMLKNNHDETAQTKDELIEEIKKLKKEVYQLRLEKDVLEKAAEILKKDEGVSLITLTNREKAMVINALRQTYKLRELLSILNMAKSSYCYQVIALSKDKYQELRKYVKMEFEDSKERYGYRRVRARISSYLGNISEKVIRRLMREQNLVVVNHKVARYNSYKGEISPEVDNLINRDFHAEKPNEKWLTDITEFAIPAGKAYLSPIIDCFDGLPVTWTIGTSPNADLVNTMLDNAVVTLKDDEKPIVHSDRGCHYRWPGWIQRMEAAGLTRSMSKKGCSPDNSACEGFFGRLKNEMFYGRSWTNVTMEDFIKEVDSYIHWYAEKRIKISLGGMSPMDYRRKLGLID